MQPMGPNADKQRYNKLSTLGRNLTPEEEEFMRNYRRGDEAEAEDNPEEESEEFPMRGGFPIGTRRGGALEM